MSQQVAQQPNQSPPTPTAPAPTSSKYAAAIALLESWVREDFTTDPEKLRQAALELAEFKKAMNENRAATGEPPLFP